MESLINAGDFKGDCKKGTKESPKRTSFVAGGPNTTDEKWPKYDASNSQTSISLQIWSEIDR
jgi:hypothetical protein